MRHTIVFATFALILFFCSCDSDEAIKITSLQNSSLDIESPDNDESFSPGDLIAFQGRFKSNEQIDFTNLKATWKSDQDGVLYEEQLSESGYCEFSTDKLSKNIHTITFEVKNEVDSIVYTEVMIFNLLKLELAGKSDNQVTIRWTSADVQGFESYAVYASPYENILQNDEAELRAVINHPSDTILADEESKLGEKVFYQVVGKLQNGKQFKSNIISEIPGIFITTNYEFGKMISDPIRPYVYGIVGGDRWSTNPNGYGLIIINTETFQIEKRVLTDYRFSDLAIDPESNFLYLTNRSQTIVKFDLTNQSMTDSWTLTLRAHKLEIGSNNKLYYHETPPTSGSTTFGVFDLTMMENIPDKRPNNSPLTASHGDFELDRTNNRIIHGESNSTGSCLREISTVDDYLSFTKSWGCNNDGYDILLYRPSSNKIFWRYWLLDRNFNLLGVFQDENGNKEYIYSASPDGSLAAGWSHVYSSETREIVKAIPCNYTSLHFINNGQLYLLQNSFEGQFTGRLFKYTLTSD